MKKVLIPLFLFTIVFTQDIISSDNTREITIYKDAKMFKEKKSLLLSLTFKFSTGNNADTKVSVIINNIIKYVKIAFSAIIRDTKLKQQDSNSRI